MQTQLYPPDVVADSLEVHLARHSGGGHAVYLAMVLTLLGALGTLPFLRVAVSVRGSGMVRPATEKHEVVARASGIAEVVGAARGQRVERGQLLLALRDAPLEERVRLLASRSEQARRAVHDLELLTGAPGGTALPPDRFRSARHREEYAQLADELREAGVKEEKALRELERSRALARQRLVAAREVEDREFHLSQLRAERALLVARYRSGWQGALASARDELRELLAQEGAAREERALYRVEAPVTGTVEQLASLSPGSYVQAGSTLAILSPLSGLVAEVWVSPRDVGLVREDDPVRLQIDAFNHHDWGFVAGRVEEISDDYLLLNQAPAFRVRVALDRTHLELPNGVRGELRKGMTLQARFTVAERTLWQLLRDDVADWLAPAGPA